MFQILATICSISIFNKPNDIRFKRTMLPTKHPTAIYDIYKALINFNKKSLPSLPSNKHTHEHKSLHS